MVGHSILFSISFQSLPLPFAKIEVLIMDNLYTQTLWNKGFCKFILTTTYLISVNISHIISRSRKAVLLLFLYAILWNDRNWILDNFSAIIKSAQKGLTLPSCNYPRYWENVENKRMHQTNFSMSDDESIDEVYDSNVKVFVRILPLEKSCDSCAKISTDGKVRLM